MRGPGNRATALGRERKSDKAKGQAFDPIALIERGYATASDTRAWMAAMAGPINEAINAGALGSLALRYDPYGRLGDVHVHRNEFGCSNAELVAQIRNSHRTLSSGQQLAVGHALLQHGLCTVVEVTGVCPDTPALRPHGIVDMMLVVVPMGEGGAVLFNSAATSRRSIQPHERALWRTLSADLGAGCRLSARASSPDADDVECVLSSGDDVLGARGEGQPVEARERLRRAVRAVDRARASQGRADPRAALELWLGLFEGSWSLVEQFDSDGKRIVLARANDPAAPGPTAMPLRKRQVLYYVAAGWSNKEVAYTLGISESTVATHLRLALEALGLRSRADWIRMAAELAAGFQPARRKLGATTREQALGRAVVLGLI